MSENDCASGRDHDQLQSINAAIFMGFLGVVAQDKQEGDPDDGVYRRAAA